MSVYHCGCNNACHCLFHYVLFHQLAPSDYYLQAHVRTFYLNELKKAGPLWTGLRDNYCCIVMNSLTLL